MVFHGFSGVLSVNCTANKHFFHSCEGVAIDNLMVSLYRHFSPNMGEPGPSLVIVGSYQADIARAYHQPWWMAIIALCKYGPERETEQRNGDLRNVC
jgi:hypothetical protein